MSHFTPTKSNHFISASRLCNLLQLNLAGCSFQGNREFPWNDSSLNHFSVSVWSSSGVKSQEVRNQKRVWNREHILHSDSHETENKDDIYRLDTVLLSKPAYNSVIMDEMQLFYVVSKTVYQAFNVLPKKRHVLHLYVAPLRLTEAESSTDTRFQTRWSKTLTSLYLFRAAVRGRKTRTCSHSALWWKD